MSGGLKVYKNVFALAEMEKWATNIEFRKPQRDKTIPLGNGDDAIVAVSKGICVYNLRPGTYYGNELTTLIDFREYLEGKV